jgi:hypothetical protein
VYEKKLQKKGGGGNVGHDPMYPVITLASKREFRVLLLELDGGRVE